MAKSNTTTPFDALYLTDDLEGRLDEEILAGPVINVVDVKSAREPLDVLRNSPKLDLPAIDSEFPTLEEENPKVVLETPTLNALITFIANGECKCVEGTLRTLSFGKGWLCGLENVDEDQVLSAAAHYGAHEDELEVVVHVKGKSIRLVGELDFTIGFGYGDVTFTVSANEGHYVVT